MANLENTANIVLDLCTAIIGGDTAWHTKMIEYEIGYEKLPIEVTSRAEPIGHKVAKRIAKGRIVFEQVQASASRILLGQLSTPWHALTPGADIPTKTLQFHNPQEADDTNDMFMYGVVFGAVKRSVDGQGFVELEVDFEAVVDSNSKVWRVGMTAA